MSHTLPRPVELNHDHRRDQHDHDHDEHAHESSVWSRLTHEVSEFLGGIPTTAPTRSTKPSKPTRPGVGRY